MSNTESIITIPITQLDKYIVTCEIDGAVDFQHIQLLAQNLDRRWASDSKFFVLVEKDGMPKVRFERIESEDDNEL